MKIFLTEFKYKDAIYEGPNIIAEDLKKAQEKANVLNEVVKPNIVVVGILTDIGTTEDTSWNRVLH